MAHIAHLVEDLGPINDDNLLQYEAAVVDEARRIAAGQSMMLATGEHLRVLLRWLDGREPERQAPAWDGVGNPF